MRLWIGFGLALLLVLRPASAGDPVAGLYQASYIVTGSDTRFRETGITHNLREVLVKVSGEPRLEQDPRVDALVAQADRLVAYTLYRDTMEGIHHHDDQGTYDRPFDLTVQFDPMKIDSALGALGEKPWTAERPILVPVIVVHGFEKPYLLQHRLVSDIGSDSEVAAEQRGSLTLFAARYGIHLRFPSEADLAAWGVSGEGMPAPAGALAPDMVLVAGTLQFRLATLGWVGAWRMQWKHTVYEWGVSGVSYDQAFRNLVAGFVRVVSGHGKPD